MIAAREALGWTQAEVADAAGVSLERVRHFETLNYWGRETSLRAAAASVAAALEISIEQVLPDELIGQSIETTKTVRADVDPGRLLEAKESLERRLVCASPAHADEFSLGHGETDAAAQMVRRLLDEFASKARPCLQVRRQIQVLQWRYLDGLTLDEAGAKLHVSRERVRQIELSGLKRMRSMFS